MDDIETLRRALGPAAGEYNEVQLRQLSRELDVMAEFLLDLYVFRQSEKRKTKGRTFDDDAPIS